MSEAIDASIEHLIRARNLLNYNEQMKPQEHEKVLIAHSVALFVDMGIDALTDPFSSLAPKHDDVPADTIDFDVAIWQKLRWRKRGKSLKLTQFG